MTEYWKDIEGFEGLYQASNFGRIKGVERVIVGKDGKPKRIKSRIKNYQHYSNGYAFVSLSRNGIKKAHLVHRLVAKSFIPNPENKPEVNHIDFNKDNNSIENLEWCTHSENHKHLFDNGTKNPFFSDNAGENNGRSILSENDVRDVKRRLIKGETRKSISKDYGVSISAIHSIARGKNWKNVKI